MTRKARKRYSLELLQHAFQDSILDISRCSHYNRQYTIGQRFSNDTRKIFLGTGSSTLEQISFISFCALVRLLNYHGCCNFFIPDPFSSKQQFTSASIPFFLLQRTFVYPFLFDYFPHKSYFVVKCIESSG